MEVILELKLLADVGLVGFPNAGKSTLISVLSSARPKIADYPFTTLVPNLGIASIDVGQNFTIADIPGLIEGAADGKGLGIQFLRHVERCRLLVFLIPADSPHPEKDYMILRKELDKYNPDIDEKDLKSGSLTLMTVHSAKGLEYPIVFISGMERGLFPLQRQDMHEEEEEEERRLFYVGVTRAKERLLLTYADRRARYGDVSEQSPSNFLREINPDLINRPEYRKPTTSFTAPKPKLFAKKEDTSYSSVNQIPEQDYYSQIEPVNVSFKVGDVIKHPHFGKGKIMHLSGVGKQLKAVIKFDSIGNKNLMLEYAKLEKI
jgi:hypothetical protein